MKIEKITVRAGRCVPHPLYSYGNLKADLEIVAQLEAGEDPDTVRRELQAKVESDVEQHVADLKDGIQDLQAANDTRQRIKRLEYELAEKSQELNGLKEEWKEMPLLRPRKKMVGTAESGDARDA